MKNATSRIVGRKPSSNVLHNDRPVPLPPKAFETLLLLVENQGHLLEKDAFLKRVWADSFVEEVALAQKYRETHDPAMARTLLAEAGFLAGLKVKCTSWPGYGPEYVDDLERLAGHLQRAGVELQIVNEDYGQYIRGSFLGRFDEATWGPSSIFTDVDGYLSGSFRTGQAGNRSHVADPQLDAMLEAQRRVGSMSSRKRIVDEIQRRAAAQVYYVYTPYARNVSSWALRVRNYGPKNSFDRGAQLEVVWLDPA